ncbi:MAG: tRNA lysidine(34) synthetase TilS [Waddliaceae bacterium]
MRDQLQRVVEKFLLQHHDGRRPLLLALSGGPDSLTLLHLLHACCETLNIAYAIAHLDHGWREESGQEAAQLEQLSRQLRVPFHCKKASFSEVRGNLEASGRQARLRFFRRLCLRYDYQAVLLAHHKDDQAETVLKNVLEGANLSSCSGIKDLVVIDDLAIWRPLLEVPKSDLLKWLENHRLMPFFDPTNEDPRFLRGRLRTQIIPEMTRLFGKGITSSLCHIGKDAQELHRYLEEKLGPLLQTADVSATGSFLDLSSTCPKSPLEVKFILRRICRQHHCSLSREILEQGADHLLLRSANRAFSMGKFTLHIDRGRIFLSPFSFSVIPAKRVELERTMRYGLWLVATERSRGGGRLFSDWKKVWKGRTEVILPLGTKPYHIGSPCLQHPFPRTSPLRKWWNLHKVPAFLRSVTPVIWYGDHMAHEFLTGQNTHKIEANEESLKVVLTRENEFESE